MFITEFLYRIKRFFINLKKKYFSVNNPSTYILSDKSFTKKQYRQKTGEKLNLKKPHTLVEKMLWLKVYNRNDLHTTLVDKYKVRDYIADKIGSEYLVPLLGVWDRADDIDFSSLPEKYVLKCNHFSDVLIYKDGLFKSKSGKVFTDTAAVVSFLNNQLATDYYKSKKEWPYKNVERKIICESFLENKDGSDLVDYKFYCFGGKMQYFMYSVGEADYKLLNHKFDRDCNSIDHYFKEAPSIPLEDIVLPSNIDEMIKLADTLCKDEPHIRVDLYNVDGKIYFGELTFFSHSGYMYILNKEYEQQIADKIDLSIVKRK